MKSKITAQELSDITGYDIQHIWRLARAKIIPPINHKKKPWLFDYLETKVKLNAYQKTRWDNHPLYKKRRIKKINTAPAQKSLYDFM